LLISLPLIWLAWEWVASMRTLDARLSQAVLKHFAACVVCFYLGFFSLGRHGTLAPFWPGWLCGFGLVLAIGWHQHFGGLAETRRYFELYMRPQAKDIPAEFLAKMSSSRIFATLFYPNALAGALLLFLPASIAVVVEARNLLTSGARILVGTLLGVAAAGCMYWSGSKAGWLLMMLMGLVTLLRLPFGRHYKVALVAAIVVVGSAGFFWKYSGYFSKGATSVSARADYWRAALLTTRERPVFGTGPGTFQIAYERVKRPESEPSRLTHNDYLEQASDSGLPGFFLYAMFITGALVWGYPKQDWTAFGVWLGVLGWALQGLVEFGLYIPALAWPAFAFLGWMLARKAARAG
jgi:hypothetical protein